MMNWESDSDDFFDFDWNRYLMVRNAEEVPDSFFFHVYKSELNGIELGSVVEIENDLNGYWYASVCSSKGVLVNLHYVGYEEDEHNFWLEVKSSRIHPLNWGRENNKKLVPPYRDRSLRVNPLIIKQKIQDNEHIVSNAVLQLGGAPIYNIFKTEMFVEVQDKEYPYRVWISKILKNIGGRLLLKTEGISCSDVEPFWLFYLNERVFPLGWAEQKGLPWRVMNSDASIKDDLDSSSLLNVLKPKTPEQHSFKVGEMLEVLNPYSLIVFHVATIIKIYDNRYFKVEVYNKSDIDKRITFVATKENPYLFNAGWATENNFLLKPPFDWTSANPFCWSQYISMKNSRLANINNVCTKNIDCVHVGMKLEEVDPLNPDCIRIATVKKIVDNWMFLSFDRTSWDQELLHVRSVYSHDIFPIGWCNKHKYLLTTPELPFVNRVNYENHYYASDVDIDFNELSEENLKKYSCFVNGEVFYHFSKKGTQMLKNKSKELCQNILNENCNQSSNILETINNNIDNNVKVEPTEVDEEFHDALFLDDELNINTNNEIYVDKKDNFKIIKEELGTNIYEICIYFNKFCSYGSNMSKRKVNMLPECLGPGPVIQILQKAINTFIDLYHFPGKILEHINAIQSIFLKGPGGVKVPISIDGTETVPSRTETISLPETEKLADRYCGYLCNFCDCCEYFMSTKKIICPYDNNNAQANTSSKLMSEKESTSVSMNFTKKKVDSTETSYHYTNSISKLMPEIETESSSMICTKRKIDFTDNPLSCDYKKTKESFSELISKTDNTLKQKVDSKTSETPHLYDYDSNTNPISKLMPETETKSSSMICTKRKIDFTDNPLSYDYKKTKESFSELMSKADNTIKQKVDSETSETPHLYDYDSNTNPISKLMSETEPESSSLIYTKRKIDFTDNPLSYNHKKTKKSFSKSDSDTESASYSIKFTKRKTDSTEIPSNYDIDSNTNSISKSDSETESVSFSMKSTKRKTDSTKILNNYDNDSNINSNSKLISDTESTSLSMNCSLNNKHSIGDKKLPMNCKLVKYMSDKAVEIGLNWVNKYLVERYKYYLACIAHYDAYVLNLKHTLNQEEVAIIEEIQFKKNFLKLMDREDIFSNTKSDSFYTFDRQLYFTKDWKCSLINYYINHPLCNEIEINIFDFKHINVTSNPKYWSPNDVLKYLSNDVHCKQLLKSIIEQKIDGVAFMLLNEEQLLRYLHFPINYALRIMCHVAEVKYICLTEYINS